jgi:hypothetical protein
MGLLVYVVFTSIISLILFPVNEVLKRGAAAPFTTVKINKTTLDNPQNSRVIVNKNPIYQATGWTLGTTKLKSAGFPQQVEVIFENGYCI